MKFLPDCRAASRTLYAALVDHGHDVLSAIAGYSTASDETLLALALRKQRVLITEDKDFGELVFLRRLPHPWIVRLVGLAAEEKPDAIRDPIHHRTPRGRHARRSDHRRHRDARADKIRQRHRQHLIRVSALGATSARPPAIHASRASPPSSYTAIPKPPHAAAAPRPNRQAPLIISFRPRLAPDTRGRAEPSSEARSSRSISSPHRDRSSSSA